MTNIQDLIRDDNYLNIYRFGSIVYGTNSELSDEDYICVTKTKVEKTNINVHIFTVEEFKIFIVNHDIQVLECLFLPQEMILKKTIDFEFNLVKSQLRQSLSTVSNGAWVKGKKKLTVLADYNKYLAIKSIFHSIRILQFGIQLASSNFDNKINYGSANKVWQEILELSKHHEHFELWEAIYSKYKLLFNSLKSEFVHLCPLEYNKNDIKRDKLKALLKSFDIQNESLENEIYSLFVK